jgi:hypothetical protein
MTLYEARLRRAAADLPVATGTGQVTLRPIGEKVVSETLDAEVAERVDYVAGIARSYIDGTACEREVWT